MDDQLLLTMIFEGTEIGQTCARFSNFDVWKVGDQHIGGPRVSNVGGPVPMAVALIIDITQAQKIVQVFTR